MKTPSTTAWGPTNVPNSERYLLVSLLQRVIDVELTDAARDDLLRLRDHLRTRHGQPLSGEFAELEDQATVRAVQRAAISALAELRDNPWTGAPFR